MKILAISTEAEGVNWDLEQPAMIKEAAEVYRLYLDEKVRELYFTENYDAVIILECEGVEEAGRLVNRLPLVKKKLISFRFMELHPYTGLSRIMEGEI